jgi:hypothetical protein
VALADQSVGQVATDESSTTRDDRFQRFPHVKISAPRQAPPF